jgi:hypothetical protein
MSTDAELYALLLQRYQDIAAAMALVREAFEKAFGVTLPSTTTMKAQLEAVASAIHAVADRLQPTRANFAYRVDRWDAAGNNIMEHVAGLEDYSVAQAAYDCACRRWPKEVVTLRHGARLMEDSRRR